MAKPSRKTGDMSEEELWATIATTKQNMEYIREETELLKRKANQLVFEVDRLQGVRTDLAAGVVEEAMERNSDPQLQNTLVGYSQKDANDFISMHDQLKDKHTGGVTLNTILKVLEDSPYGSKRQQQAREIFRLVDHQETGVLKLRQFSQFMQHIDRLNVQQMQLERVRKPSDMPPELQGIAERLASFAEDNQILAEQMDMISERATHLRVHGTPLPLEEQQGMMSPPVSRKKKAKKKLGTKKKKKKAKVVKEAWPDDVSVASSSVYSVTGGTRKKKKKKKTTTRERSGTGVVKKKKKKKLVTKQRTKSVTSIGGGVDIDRLVDMDHDDDDEYDTQSELSMSYAESEASVSISSRSGLSTRKKKKKKTKKSAKSAKDKARAEEARKKVAEATAVKEEALARAEEEEAKRKAAHKVLLKEKNKRKAAEKELAEFRAQIEDELERQQEELEEQLAKVEQERAKQKQQIEKERAKMREEREKAEKEAEEHRKAVQAEQEEMHRALEEEFSQRRQELEAKLVAKDKEIAYERRRSMSIHYRRGSSLSRRGSSKGRASSSDIKETIELEIQRDELTESMLREEWFSIEVGKGIHLRIVNGNLSASKLFTDAEMKSAMFHAVPGLVVGSNVISLQPRGSSSSPLDVHKLLRFDAKRVVVEKELDMPTGNWRKEVSWRVRPPLQSSKNKKAFSLESVSKPGYFMRWAAMKKQLVVEREGQQGSADAFRKDATFKMVEAAWKPDEEDP